MARTTPATPPGLDVDDEAMPAELDGGPRGWFIELKVDRRTFERAYAS